MRFRTLILTAFVTLPLSASSLMGQGYPESVQRALDRCRDQELDDDWGYRERMCEVRTVAVRRGTPVLDIDGHPNGSVHVTGWDRDSIAVYALVQVHARDLERARALAQELRITESSGRIRGDGPSRANGSSYSVSYQVLAPRGMEIRARTGNGGVRVNGLNGRVDVAARNGGISIEGAGGDVRGRTTNGGITLSLSGTRWNGRGVDLETTNGGVSVTIPENFNGELDASTTNGGFSVDFPVTVQGRIGRRLTTRLGQGGPTIRVQTTNGGVRIRRA